MIECCVESKIAVKNGTCIDCVCIAGREPASAADESQASVLIVRKRLKVGLADDNPSIHEDIRATLKTRDDDQLASTEAELFGESAPEPGQGVSDVEFDLQSARQGQQALAMVEEAMRSGQPFSMAFVDVRMPPGWNGIETIQHLWKVDPDLEVVICTAYSDYSWREIIEQLGVTDRFLILQKPFDGVEVR